MTRRRARLAVVGLGRIGRLHASNLAGSVRSAELAGVVDADRALARSMAGRFGVPWSTSLDGMDWEVDGMVVAAPTRFHCELVERAAAAGKPVFCEKPLGFDVAAADRALGAARAGGIALQVGYQRRFDRGWLELKAALDSGQLGEGELLRISHRNARPPDADAGLGDVFADLAVHDLDAARWIGGEVAELFVLARDRAPASAGISLRFRGGGIALIDVSRVASYGFECSAELVGSEATMRIGHVHRHRDFELLRAGDARVAIARDHAERHGAAYAAELEHFARVALGGPAGGPSGEDALAALRLAKLAARSLAAGAPLAVAAPEPLAAVPS